METGFFGSLFAPIENLLHWLIEISYSITESLGLANYGLAIILLTVVIKLLMYPLTAKQIESMKAMQVLQPKMKEIQDKYKDKPQVMQKKLTELYQQTGVNPLAGCLPMLIQMPILMGMYYALFNFDYGTADQSFLWLPSLSQEDETYILPILSGLTTWLQQKLSMTDTSSQQAKIMMTIMPLFIGWISINFPAGLVLYWVTMNIVQIAQQWWMSREDTNSDKKESA